MYNNGVFNKKFFDKINSMVYILFSTLKILKGNATSKNESFNIEYSLVKYIIREET